MAVVWMAAVWVVTYHPQVFCAVEHRGSYCLCGGHCVVVTETEGESENESERPYGEVTVVLLAVKEDVLLLRRRGKRRRKVKVGIGIASHELAGDWSVLRAGIYLYPEDARPWRANSSGVGKRSDVDQGKDGRRAGVTRPSLEVQLRRNALSGCRRWACERLHHPAGVSTRYRQLPVRDM